MRKKKPAPHPGSIHMGIGIGVTGSAHADEVTVEREDIFLESSAGTFEINSYGNDVAMSIGADPVLWLLASDSFGFLPPERLPWNLSKSGALEETQDVLADNIFHGLPKPNDSQLLHLANWQRRPSMMMRHMRDVSQVKRLRLDASALRKDLSLEDHRGSIVGSAGEGLASAIAKLRGHKPEPSRQFREVLEGLHEVYPRIQDVTTRRIPSGHLILLFKE